MLRFLLGVFGFLGGITAIIFTIFYYVDKQDCMTISYKEFKGLYGISPDSWDIVTSWSEFNRISYVNSSNHYHQYLLAGKTFRDYLLIRHTINNRKKLLKKREINRLKGDMLKDLKKDVEMYKKNCWENLRDYGMTSMVDENGLPKFTPKIPTKKEQP